MTPQQLGTFLIVASCLGASSNAQLLSSIINTIGLGPASVQFLDQNAEFKQAEPTEMTPRSNAEYDFIVVGAGSAGAVVASRLSEITEAKILLLEAGGGEDLMMGIPMTASYLQFNDDLNWGYRTEPSESYCLGMDDRRCNWPRGKVMGGSSVLNSMIATRGNKRDYDRWEELGNTGWSWKDVLYYFKKLESIGIPELKQDTEMHNTKGPLAINYPPFQTPLATAFIDAGVELGFKVQDYNGQTETGFSYVQTTTANGSRVSSSKAYLHPANNRQNLFVSKNSLVSQVLIDPTEKRAVGVEFIKNNETFVVRVRKEVILSAGTIGTAQLLMLSGIGPADHLEEIGIPVIKDAPVGKNLMDHVAYGGFTALIDDPVSIDVDALVDPLNPYLSDYLNSRQGPLTIPAGCEGIAYLNTDTPHDPDSWPNVELGYLSTPLGPAAFGISQSFWDMTYKPIENKPAWTLWPIILRPLSRGEILLSDRNISTHPRIFPNYLSHPDDVRVIVAGIRAAQNLSRTRAMARVGSRPYDVKFPGCENLQYDSDDYWECAVRTLTFTVYHHCGTAKMGPDGDPTTVVNSRLQVHGIKGLRVADASIFPEIPAAHTNIPTIMVAEKLSDMVKEDWGYPINLQQNLLNNKKTLVSRRQ